MTFTVFAGLVQCPATAGCPADVDCDGEVGVNDLVQVIMNWGSCPTP